MAETPKCPDCDVELEWPVPPGTPAYLNPWLGGPYTCPKCRQEYDVDWLLCVQARLAGPPREHFVATFDEPVSVEVPK